LPVDLQLEAAECGQEFPSRRVNSAASGVTSAGALLRPGHWAVLIGLVALGSLLRVWAVFQYNPLEILVTDPGRWWEEATHLSSLQPIAAIDTFGYPLWLGLFVKLTGGGALAVALHNAALSVITPWIWHRLVREVSDDRDIALLSWAAFCWLPSWISIYSYTMSETLFLPLLGAALWLSVKAYKQASTGPYFASACLWALACATRVFALPIAVVMLLWTCRNPRRISKLGYAALAFAVIAIPLSIRTHYILNVWHPFGFPRMNQIYVESGKRTVRFDVSRESDGYRWTYEFGSPSLYQEPFTPLSHWKSARSGTTYFSIREDHGMADWDLALQANRSSWRERMQVWSENFIFFNFAPSWPDDNPNRVADEAASMFRWCWVPLALVVIAGNMRHRKQLGSGIAGMFAVVTTLAWTLTPLLPAVMEGRYRKPVEGLLLVNLFLLIECRRERLATAV